MSWLKSALNHLLVGLLNALTYLPYPALVHLGYGLGWLAAHIPSERRQVVKTNLQHCFPELSTKAISSLAVAHWCLLGRSLLERSIIWRGSIKQLSNMIEVRSAVDLADRKPRILVNPHFVGIEGSIIISALAKEHNWPRTSGFFQRMKTPFFNQKIITWRNRFGGNSIEREGNMIQLIREIRDGNFVIIAPDIDLGIKDSAFVPFFGILTNTITAVSRLAQVTKAEVCIMSTTLKVDESGYICEIRAPLADFPSTDVNADTAFLNQQIEILVRERPAEYYWVHKRFKNRPNGETSFY